MCLSTSPGCVCVCVERKGLGTQWDRAGCLEARVAQQEQGRSRSARGTDLLRFLCRQFGGEREELVVAVVIVGTRDEGCDIWGSAMRQEKLSQTQYCNAWMRQ